MTPCVRRCWQSLNLEQVQGLQRPRCTNMTKSMMTRWILILLSKVKGKNKFSGSCYICGKVGHKSTECWSRDTVSNKGSGGHQNANVTSSGKGKSVGKGAEGAKRHQRSRQEQGQRQVEIQRQKGVSERQTRRFLEFEEESWEETNETEQVKWWNSWTEDMEPRRDEALLGAFMVGGTEFELNSFKTASGEILPDEGQLMWPCFLQEGRKCWLRGHVTDVQRPLISAGKVLGKDKVAILHSGGGSIFSWNSPTGNLISRAMTKDTRQARSDELIRLYREDIIYNFYVKGFDGNWQAQNFDTGAAVSVLHRSYAKPVQQLPGKRQSAGSVGNSRSQAVRPIAAEASSSGSRGEQNTDMDVVTEVREPVQARAGMQRSLERESLPNLQREVKRKMTSFRGPEE